MPCTTAYNLNNYHFQHCDNGEAKPSGVQSEKNATTLQTCTRTSIPLVYNPTLKEVCPTWDCYFLQARDNLSPIQIPMLNPETTSKLKRFKLQRLLCKVLSCTDRLNFIFLKKLFWSFEGGNLTLDWYYQTPGFWIVNKFQANFVHAMKEQSDMTGLNIMMTISKFLFKKLFYEDLYLVPCLITSISDEWVFKSSQTGCHQQLDKHIFYVIGVPTGKTHHL